MKANRTIACWLMLLALATFNLQPATASAQTWGFNWTSLNVPSSLTGVSCLAASADGSKLILGVYGNGLDISTDSGATWTESSAAYAGWQAVVASSDFTKLLAVSVSGYADMDGGIYTSVDSGTNWTQQPFAPAITGAIAGSADGSKLLAVVTSASSGNAIYTSADSGTNWNLSIGFLTADWMAVACSTNGSNLVAVSMETQTSATGGPIFVSTNAGASWTTTSAPQEVWESVASSADGNKLVAIENSYGGIYTSTNAGATWSLRNLTSLYPHWNSVASSADGCRLVVAGAGKVIFSADSGATWHDTGANLTSPWVLAQPDGLKFLGIQSGTGIQAMTWQIIPVPTLNISRAGKNVVLSWPTNATGYTAQENANIPVNSWIGIDPSQTIVAGTNNSVTLPVSTDDNVFFRLSHP
jgi:hypothetical protein